MADPAFIVDKIIELALAIKKAVETVRENKEECRGIERRVSRISELLSLLREKGTTAMMHRAMSDALEDLEDTVGRAHEVVTACQGRNIFCLFCAAGKLARQLRQVKDDILQNMMMAIFAGNVVDFVEAKSQQANPQFFDLAHPVSGNVPSPPSPITVLADVPPHPPAHLSPPLPRVAAVEENLNSHLPAQAQLAPPARQATHVPQQILRRPPPTTDTAPPPKLESLLPPPRLPQHRSPPTTQPPPSPVTYNAPPPPSSPPSLPKHITPRQPASPPPPAAGIAPPQHGHPPAHLPHPSAQSTRDDSTLPASARVPSHLSTDDVSGKSAVTDGRREVPARSEVSSPMLTGIKNFSLSELKAATQNFSVKNKIGSSDSVTLYKGVLRNGLKVAIKEVKGPSQFLMARICTELLLASELQSNEVSMLGRTARKSYLKEGLGTGDDSLLQKNKYIINVLGYGYEFIRKQSLVQPHIFLVQEHMPNGNMGNIIYGPPFDWSYRLRIIQGLAWGLHYLHERNVVHMNVKPDNILLDSDMNPKISGFGIARILNGPMINDDNIAGTVGYMPPEYILEGILSTKFDVYSFGIILLETISGMCSDEATRHQASVQWAWKKRDQMDKVFNPSLYDESQLVEIERCLEIGLLCTQSEPKRPTMVDILETLNSKKELPIPSQPEYTKERDVSVNMARRKLRGRR